MIRQGDVWWADLGAPRGSEPGYRRPVVVVQGDALNRSRIATVLCVPLTSNQRWAAAPGNVLLAPSVTGLDRLSVANVTQCYSFDREVLVERVGRLGRKQLELIFAGLDVVMERVHEL